MRPAPDVVHVVCTNAFAGVERYVTTLARVQDARGMRVQVLGGSAARMTSELQGSGVRWAPASTPWQAVVALRRLPDADVVHAHMTAAETAAVIASRGPVVSTRHFAGTRGSTAPARVIGRYVSGRIAEQVAISEFVARAVEGRSTVIHPGVNAQPDARRERQPVVLIAQRLETEKRTDIGLRMWAASGLAHQGWRLQIAGDGARRSDIERLADALDVTDSCDFLGDRTDVAALMASVAVFLAPRPDEPYGLSVVEAMAHGTPVVAASGGGHDETVGSSPDAVLVPAIDPARAGALLAELALDLVRRTAYGDALRVLQRDRFTVEAHADRLDVVYRAARR